MHSFGILSLLIFTPIIGVVLLAFCPLYWPKYDSDGARARRLAFSVSGITLALSFLLLLAFQVNQGGYQFAEQIDWIPQYGVSWRLGVDGVSLCLIMLTTALLPLVVVAAESIRNQTRGYLCCMLLLEAAVLGSLVALDLLLFYLFWELMLAPLFFIIGIWGGKRRIYASLKFVLFTVFGSVLMLAAILYLVWSHAQHSGETTFALESLLASSRLSMVQEFWLFMAFGLAFAIKIPLIPFHTWLPDAHVEAPTGGSVVLAAVLLKVGFYGMVRFAYPLFPRAAEVFGPAIVCLAVGGIVYAALVAWVQTDIKKLIAYSSISHLGFCVLGLVALNPLALSGALFQMISHGIVSAGLFFLVGMLYQRQHTRLIFNYGGLATTVPLLASCWFVFTLGAIGLPLTSGFVGEFMVLLGAFKSELFRTWAVIAVLGVVLSALYMLSLYLKIGFGEEKKFRDGALYDLNAKELFILVPLILALFLLGIYPRPLLRLIEPAAQEMLATQKDRFMELERYEAETIFEDNNDNMERPMESGQEPFQTAMRAVDWRTPYWGEIADYIPLTI